MLKILDAANNEELSKAYPSKEFTYSVPDAMTILGDLIGDQPDRDKILNYIRSVSPGGDMITIKFFYDPETEDIKYFKPIIRENRNVRSGAS